MLQKPTGRDEPREVTSPSSATGSGVNTQVTQPSESAMFAAPAQAAQSVALTSLTRRPTLPPLSYLQAGSQFPLSPSASATSYSGPSSHVLPSQYNSPTVPQTFPAFGVSARNPDTLPFRGSESDQYGHSPIAEPGHFSPPQGQSYNPLKRPRETPPSSLERPQYGTVPYSVATGDMSEHRGHPYSSSASNTSTPTTTSYPALRNTQAYSSSRATSSIYASRFSLHIRQQPRAARAGPDGKDRRPIDPPPILQLLMNDFNINDPSEVEELHSSFWVTHCRLVSSNSPHRDMSTLVSPAEDGSKEIQRLLLGTTVASPFHTKDDPYPATMPLHPISETEPTDPPSPSERFIPSSRSERKRPAQNPPYLNPRAGSTPATPGTFFIFADISVRKAGEYRLEFSLMHMDPQSLSAPGFNVPIICAAASQVFRVVNAKDFDQVKASTSLVRGLVERGAGFPLKLKKGTRAGEGRRHDGEGQSQGGEDSDSEDGSNESQR